MICRRIGCSAFGKQHERHVHEEQSPYAEAIAYDNGPWSLGIKENLLVSDEEFTGRFLNDLARIARAVRAMNTKEGRER